jgi:hypothetical protein
MSWNIFETISIIPITYKKEEQFEDMLIVKHKVIGKVISCDLLQLMYEMRTISGEVRK